MFGDGRVVENLLVAERLTSGADEAHAACAVRLRERWRRSVGDPGQVVVLRLAERDVLTGSSGARRCWAHPQCNERKRKHHNAAGPDEACSTSEHDASIDQ